MGVTSGPALQPVHLDHALGRMEPEDDQQGGPRSPQLTQLCSSDYKFGHIDFRAEFISQPIGDFQLGGLEVEEALNLPSFSDTYNTKSVITTIEPRMFGAEAEYEARLRQQRESKHQILEAKDDIGGYSQDGLEPVRLNSVIIPTSSRSLENSEVDSRDASPSPSLSILPTLHNSIETFLHSQDGSLSDTSESSFSKQDHSDSVPTSLYIPTTLYHHQTISNSDLSEFSSSFSSSSLGQTVLLSCNKMEPGSLETSERVKLPSSPL